MAVARAVFTPRTRPGLRVTAEQLAGLLDHPDLDWQLVDARDAGQYTRSQAPRSARRTHPRRDTRPARAVLSRRREDFSRWTKSAGGFANMGFAPTGRPLLIATEASRPPSFSSTWRGWASPISPITTVRGTNGRAGSISPWNPDRPLTRPQARGARRSFPFANGEPT